ncbi:hypothetical protein Lwal_1324 [Legionella waltersii]|uniref:Methyltransferase type 11 domain-containing protein n=2 Tax=Legionella waltersii TaxID=66969 RepID=A0A0W1ADA3_9GAMM|nr:class I SAM-dependent methyltransferase [Legionella waltersii]KTD79252.1 hypothetical protein Lwal_1324 [Legionella waltersii]SNV12728.1 O-methyltransferase [Legionella waltersii]
MEMEPKSFRRTAEQIGFVITHQCYENSEANLMKEQIQDTYTFWGKIFNNVRFMNLGLWNRKIYNEYTALPFNFSTISKTQDIYSQLHLYFMIRPLIKKAFFNKRLLEIGCGNGIGLKASSQLLKTSHALGIDLVNQHVNNAMKSFHEENKVNYIQSDAERLPIEDNSVDIITNLESSHLYPRIQLFFAEVERVLAPGGYFCYADHDVPVKSQAKRFEAFLKSNPNMKVIQKTNITRMVQSSIYERIIAREDNFYNSSLQLFGANSPNLGIDMLHLAYAVGLIFLPWWWIRFKRPELHYIAKAARREKFWGKKYYFYYLIQKIK